MVYKMSKNVQNTISGYNIQDEKSIDNGNRRQRTIGNWQGARPNKPKIEYI